MLVCAGEIDYIIYGKAESESRKNMPKNKTNAADGIRNVDILLYISRNTQRRMYHIICGLDGAWHSNPPHYYFKMTFPSSTRPSGILICRSPVLTMRTVPRITTSAPKRTSPCTTSFSHPTSEGAPRLNRAFI